MKRKGQSLVEYTLILALVSVVAIMSLSALGRSLNDTFSKVNNALSGVSTPSDCGGNTHHDNGHHYGNDKGDNHR